MIPKWSASSAMSPAATYWSRSSVEPLDGGSRSAVRCIEVDRDVRGCAFLFHDDVILRLCDNRLDLGNHVALRHREPCRVGANLLILETCQDHPFDTFRIGALA